MKNKVKHSFGKKISIFFIFFVGVMLAGLIIIVGILYSNFASSQVEEQTLYEDKLVSQQIDLLQTHANNCANNVIINVNAMLSAGEIPKATFDDSVLNTKIMNALSGASTLYPMFKSISVVFDSKAIYSREKKGMGLNYIANDTFLQQLNSFQFTTQGEWQRYLDLPTASISSPLYYVKVFRDLVTNKPIGHVLILANEEEIYKSYAKEGYAKDATQIYITDENGFLISGTDRQLVQNSFKADAVFNTDIVKAAKDSKEKMQVYQTELQNGWEITSVVEVNKLTMGLSDLFSNILVFGLIVLILFSIVVLMVVRRITRPINQISELMLNFDISNPQRLSVKQTEDEIGMLISSFNTMVDKNAEMFARIEKEQINKRHLELALLQNQIKPHFLYNTLDTIYCLSSMGETEDSAKVTKLLADYYRNVLNKGSEWISIENEIQALEKYLDIQTVRYNDILSYEIECDSELYNIHIPKLTLQPIVENAIYHGIKPKRSKGKIKIHAYKDDDMVYIKVSDDGIGMTKERFEQKIKDNTKEVLTDSFGMKNVNERLNLFFGNTSGLHFEESEVGTTIVVCIDLKK